MTKKKNSYWDAREQNWIDQNVKDDAAFDKQLAKQYESTIKDIDKQIDEFYMRYAGKEGLTKHQAMMKVASEDVKGFQSKAKKLVKAKDFSPEANQQLRLYNATMRINRLEMLKAQIGENLIDLGNQQQASLNDKFTKSYLAEIKRQAGILGETDIGDLKLKATAVANGSFQGATWSSRLWTSNAELQAELGIQLNQAMIQGLNPRVIASKLKPLLHETIKNKTAVAERLARTETARVQDSAGMDMFSKYGVKYVKWYAEPSACKVCLDIAAQNDGVYSLEDVPDIPIHPNCRCAKGAYVDDYSQGVTVSKSSDIPEVAPEPEFTDSNPNYSKFTTGNLTDDQRESLQSYYSGAAYDVNSDLRAGMQINETDYTKSLASAISDNHTKADMTIYRKIESGNLQKLSNEYYANHPDKAFPELKVGDTFSDKAFMSTSTSKNVDRFNPKAKYFEGDTEFYIDIPKGSSAIDLAPIADKDLGKGVASEQEMLLHPNAKFKVTSITEKKLDNPIIIGDRYDGGQIDTDVIKQIHMKMIDDGTGRTITRKASQTLSSDYEYLKPGAEKSSFLAAQRDKKWKTLSDEQKALIKDYTQGVAGDWNQAVQNKVTASKWFKENNIDSVLKKETGYSTDEYLDAVKELTDTPIGKNVRLFRGVKEHEFNWIKQSNQWNTMTSTATNDSQNDFFTMVHGDVSGDEIYTNYRVNMYTTPDVKGLYVGDKTSYSENQYEYLLRPGTKYRLLPSDDDHVINMQLFPEDATDDMINKATIPNLGKNQMELTASQAKAKAKAEEEAKLADKTAAGAEKVREQSLQYIGKSLHTAKNGDGKVVDTIVKEKPFSSGKEFNTFVKIRFENGAEQTLTLKECEARLK